MTLLVISPDYASHLLPLATLATAWSEVGEEVVVAGGPSTAALTAAFGFRRIDLELGRGSNPGVIRVKDQPAGEDTALQGFFDATRLGMLATLTFQANARTTDLLWNPVANGRRVLEIVQQVRPTEILVDHLAFSARIALDAAGIRYGDVVLGHPTALPVPGELYGLPTSWPRCFDPQPAGLQELATICASVTEVFTEQWNSAAAELGSSAPAVADAFATSGDLLLLNYPRQLHPAARTDALPPHRFLGSAVRTEAGDPEVDRWLAEDDRPIVFVSFGSFLSARGDVLAAVVEALRPLDLRVALAFGSTDPASLPGIPDSWLVRGFLPQVTIVARAALLITHAGNNSVTEAVTLGVPMVMLPFSTDQFAGAAAVESYGLGVGLDPNAAGPGDIRRAVQDVLGSTAVTVASELGRTTRNSPGPDQARDALTARG